MNTFYLIRHAHADWAPDEDRPLSNKGVKDSFRVAEILSSYPIEGIFSGPYQRAVQTIEPLAKSLDLKVEIISELRERELGNYEGDDFFAAVEATWHDPSFSHPGGESNAAAQQRGVSVVLRLKDQFPGTQLVLSTHGNLMALIIQYFNTAVGYTFWKGLSMPDIYKIEFGAKGKPGIHRLWC